MPGIKELTDLVEVITIAIAREKASIELYKNAYRKATKESARKVFALLLEQEKLHIVNLRAQLDEINAELETERRK